MFFNTSTIYLPSLDEFPTSCQCVLERLLIRLILASTWQPTRIENHQTWFKSSEGPTGKGGGKGGHESLIVPDFEKYEKYEDLEDEIRRVARETAEMSLRELGSGKIWQNP